MMVTTQMQTTWSDIGTKRSGDWQGWEPALWSQPNARLSEMAQHERLQQDYRRSGKTATTERTNQEWLADLRGWKREEALADLRRILRKGLGFVLASYSNVGDDDIEDFVQEALVRISDKLDTFRGESRFTTWAQKIAVRVALTELRRKRWQDVSLDKLTEGQMGTEIVPRFMADPSIGPEKQAIQSSLLEQLERIIVEELSERQKRALIAVYFHGMPLEDTARRMETNRNALYKLLHDARQRLKERLLDHGISAEEMLGAFSSGSE